MKLRFITIYLFAAQMLAQSSPTKIRNPILDNDPTLPMQATTKQYVDNHVFGPGNLVALTPTSLGAVKGNGTSTTCSDVNSILVGFNTDGSINCAPSLFSIGVITTLPQGSTATVTNSGTSRNPILNFGIPQGANSTTTATGVNGDFNVPGLLSAKIYSGNIYDVTGYGAVGNSTTDDTAAVQAAFDTCWNNGLPNGQSGGIVKFPGRRTYKISATVNAHSGCAIEGTNGSWGVAGRPPELVWYGAGGNDFVTFDSNGRYDQWIHNIVLKMPTGATQAQRYRDGFVFNSRIDSGSGIDNVWVSQASRYGYNFTGGGINVKLHNFRCDTVSTYCVHWGPITGNDSFDADTFTVDNHDILFGNSTSGGAFLLDGATAPSNANLWATFHNFKMETNTNLAVGEGVFKVTSNPNASNAVIYHLAFDNVWNAAGSGVTQFTGIQVTPATDWVCMMLDNSNLTISGIPSWTNLVQGATAIHSRSTICPMGKAINAGNGANRTAMEVVGDANFRQVYQHGVAANLLPWAKTDGTSFPNPNGTTLFTGQLLVDPLGQGNVKRFAVNKVYNGGTLGTLNGGLTTCSGTAGQSIVTCSSATGLAPGAVIQLPGESGKRITNIDATAPTAVVLTLSTSLVTSPSGATLSYFAPQFGFEMQIPTKTGSAPAAEIWIKGDTEQDSTATVNGPCLWVNTTAGTPGTWSRVPCGDVTGKLNMSQLNSGALYSDGFVSINNALAAAAVGQKVVVTASSTVTSNITVTGKTLECLPGVTLTKGYNGTMVTLTGDKSALLNCTIDGAQASAWTGSNVILSGATNALVERNTILNSATYGIYLTGGANKNKIRKNTVTGGLSIAIFGEKNADDNEVSDNFVSTAGANSGSHAIAFHGSLAANTVNREKITGNIIEQGAAVGFCVEVGDFGGLTSDGDTIASNKCVLVGTAAGGYSLSGATKATVGNNTFDVNGQTATIAALEMVVTTYSTATGNVLNGGTTAAKCMTLDRSSNNTVTGNVLNGWSTASGAQGLHITSSTAGVSAGANVVSGNQFIFPAGGLATKGLMIQSNNATADANFNQIVSNDFVGNGATGSNGVLLEKDAGSVAYSTVGLNKFSAIDVAVNQASDDNTTRVGNAYGTGINTAVGGSGTNSRAFDSNAVRTSNGGSLSAGTGSSVVINSLQIGSTLSSTIADSRELLQSAHFCGTTTTCANTANASNRMIFGTVTLVAGTATVTGISPAFTSTTSYICTFGSNAINPVSYSKASTSSFTITGTGTDTISYQCIGN